MPAPKTPEQLLAEFSVNIGDLADVRAWLHTLSDEPIVSNFKTRIIFTQLSIACTHVIDNLLALENQYLLRE